VNADVATPSADQAGALPPIEAAPPEKAEHPFRRFVNDYAASPVAIFGAALLALVVAIAILAPWISPQNPYDLGEIDIMDARLAPGEADFTGEKIYHLGTDDQGRDMLSAIFYGLRISLSVGVFSGIIALGIGAAVGLLAAFYGGRVDAFIMRIVDLQLSFPAILIALMLLAVLGRGIDKTMIALVAVQWAYYARTVRGSALVERQKEYVAAATCLGIGRMRIVFRHMLPNVMAPLIVVGAVQTAHAISLEETLSYLGIGLPVTEPSLGLLISNGFEYLLTGKYWISVFPGLALLLTIVSINLVGDQLRDVLNPRLSR